MSIRSWVKLPKFLQSNEFVRARLTSNSDKYDKDKDGPASICHPFDANLISSKNGKTHKLFLDLDVEHLYIKSSTEEHGHLMINLDLSKKDMLEVLEVLAKHGVIQQGFYQATKDRGYASLRMPGLQKGNPDDDRWFYDEYYF